MIKAITYLCCSCLLLFIVACKKNDGLPDLRESYSYRDAKPFGTLVAKKILQSGFSGNYIQTVKEPFAKSAETFSDSNSVYFSVSRNLFTVEEDVSAMLDYVYEGNTAFFAAARFDTLLMNKLYCRIASPSENIGNASLLYKSTATSVIKGIHTSADSFSYFYKPFRSYFSETNNNYCRIAGYNEDGKPNCIVFFWGKGKLFLHTDPRAFSNYFLLTGNNYRYMLELLQVTNASPQHVYWDDYYNRHNYQGNAGKKNNSLAEIFKYPSLKAAFLLLCLILLLYLLFGTKRKQKVINEIKPNRNSSVAFTETVARLYLQEHDNKNIADKMITYFHEFIRTNYYLYVNPASSEFISVLSKKAGIPEENTIKLMEAINKVNESEVLDDQQLLTLNEQIQQFYKKRV